MFNAVIDAPFGKIGVRLEGEAVREIVYLPDSVPNVEPDSALAKQAVEQIEQYLQHASASFDLPLADVGTPFQRRVWKAISEIPPGVVVTYGQLAKQIGSAKQNEIPMMKRIARNPHKEIAHGLAGPRNRTDGLPGRNGFRQYTH